MERLKNHYFVLVRLLLMFTFGAYGFIERANGEEVSAWVLLLFSLYLSAMGAFEVGKKKYKFLCLLLAAAFYIVLMVLGETGFLLLGFVILYDFLSLFDAVDPKIYLIPILGAAIPSPISVVTRFIAIALTAVIYIQHNFVIRSYKKQMMEDTINEQNLKRDMQQKEYAAKMEQRKNMMMAENQILEQRASLSQTLHDKLGHNINGSVYQLEAAKVLLKKDPEKSETIIQAVIDQLRGGMDEIRGILRKERPEKRQLAMLQLYKLCEDCNNKGVQTELTTEGDTAQIPDKIWEVILDNAFEAVSNSMKYSKCSRIDIGLVVMAQRVRVSIADDGIGCSEVKDGMGISGMRQRVRECNGTISFESMPGFTVTMLLPMKEE
ncbi:MAG: hypothetical protein J6Y08_08575 [Clostridiales bacterium]|nr:hypothetical protein [Clostridiales bacterium]